MQDSTSTGKKRRPAPTYAPEDQRVIPVLGMHRSGTSMVTRLLNLLGVELSWPIQPPSAERDGFIARAKVLLNIHFYEAKVFEIVRVSYLLANGCAVLSETGSSASEDADFQDAVVFAPYEDLADACVQLVADPDRRAKLGAEAQRLFRTRSQADILKDIL